MRKHLIVIGAVVVAAGCDAENSSACDAEELVVGPAVDLFDGTTLAGWDGDPAVWRVDAGAIVGSSADGYLDYNTFLISDGEYRDFVLTAEVMLVGGDGNSGIQYRSVIVNPDRWVVGGYQADVHHGTWGNIYEELFGRSDLVYADPACRDAVDETGWNTYQIEAAGCRIVHKINGVLCGEFGEGAQTRPPIGRVALQYHAPGGFEVRYRNVRIAEAVIP